MAPIIAKIKARGVTTLHGIARALNARGVRTATGKGKWEASRWGHALVTTSGSVCAAAAPRSLPVSGLVGEAEATE